MTKGPLSLPPMPDIKPPIGSMWRNATARAQGQELRYIVGGYRRWWETGEWCVEFSHNAHSGEVWCMPMDVFRNVMERLE